ncbi:hypothetical protein [Paractinoplanes atraurantiacus]|nr:hypothetical protein [Actinoplanes atraurantiacus]
MLTILGCLIAACALPVVYSWYDDLAAQRRRSSAESDGTPDGTRAEPPATLEGVLAAQLTSGEITRGQYQRAMAKIAERDDERHPLVVPPEQGAAGV